MDKERVDSMIVMGPLEYILKFVHLYLSTTNNVYISTTMP